MSCINFYAAVLNTVFAYVVANAYGWFFGMVINDRIEREMP